MSNFDILRYIFCEYIFSKCFLCFIQRVSHEDNWALLPFPPSSKFLNKIFCAEGANMSIRGLICAEGAYIPYQPVIISALS